MSENILSGKLPFSTAKKDSADEVFHRLLSRICPDGYELKRMSVYESPTRAVFEFCKEKSRSNHVFSVKLNLAKKDNALFYDILPPKKRLPWPKHSFAESMIDTLNGLTKSQ